MPNTQKIITLDTLSRFKDHLADVAISGNYGDLEGVPFWIGTQAEYDEQSETIPNNMVIIITDEDGTPLAINYVDIANKPQINNNTLIGNLTGIDLGLVDAEDGKGLSTNDYTDAEKNKLSGITSGAQVNLIETITVNGVAQAINNKTVALTIMTNAVDNLVNYYKKSETYTQSEVNALISAIPKFDIKVVDTLPTTDISNSTVYLLRTSETETGNLYTEYIYAEVTTGTYQWEKLGTQTLDLSDYVTTNELNTVLAGYVTAATLTTELAKYTDTTTLTGLLDNKVDKVVGKGLSTEDYTTEEKTKLSGVTAGAEPNVIGSISVNNTAQAPINKNVDISVPVNLTDLDDVWTGTSEEFEEDKDDIPNCTFILIPDSNESGSGGSASKPIVSAVITLTASGWTNSSQTGAVTLDTSNLNTIIIPASDYGTWAQYGIYPTAESTTGITFACTTAPATDLTFRIVSTEVTYSD